MKMVNFLSNLFCPPKCIFCDKLIGVDSMHNYCEECTKELVCYNERICEVCGRTINIPRGDLICPSCANKEYYFNKNISPLTYKGVVSKAILKMKFNSNQQWIAYAFGEILGKYIKEAYQNINFDGIVYVPISKRREKDRGYNQSKIIAISTGKLLGIPVVHDGLIKLKDNPKQSNLSATQRAKNVKGVYATGKADVSDKVLLLIDDVYTTGATLNECAKILKKSGALLVYGATVSVTEGRNAKCRLRGKRLKITKQSSTCCIN